MFRSYNSQLTSLRASSKSYMCGEMTLLRGNEMLGYPAISEPLVNIRYNLEYAVERGLIPASFAHELVEQMKTRHFAERSYQSLLNHPSLDRLAFGKCARILRN